MNTTLDDALNAMRAIRSMSTPSDRWLVGVGAWKQIQEAFAIEVRHHNRPDWTRPAMMAPHPFDFGGIEIRLCCDLPPDVVVPCDDKWAPLVRPEPAK